VHAVSDALFKIFFSVFLNIKINSLERFKREKNNNWGFKIPWGPLWTNGQQGDQPRQRDARIC
jgi:hypothetical protein